MDVGGLAPGLLQPDLQRLLGGDEEYSVQGVLLGADAELGGQEVDSTLLVLVLDLVLLLIAGAGVPSSHNNNYINGIQSSQSRESCHLL